MTIRRALPEATSPPTIGTEARVERSLLVWFLIVASLTTTLALATHLGLRDAAETSRWVIQTHAALAQIERTASSLKEAEVDYESAVKDGDFHSFLTTLEAVDREVHVLVRLTDESPRLRSSVAVVNRRLESLRKAVSVEDPQVAAVAPPAVIRSLLTAARAQIRFTSAEEYDLLVRRSTASAAADQAVTLLAWSETLGALIALFLAYRSVIRELARRREAEAQSAESEAKFTAFMDHTPVVAFMTDERNRLIYVNQPMEKLFGIRLDEVKGKNSFPGMPDWLVEGSALANLPHAGAGDLFEAVPSTDGLDRSWLVMKFPFRDNRGRSLIGGVAVDMTRQRQLQSMLEEQLRLSHGLNRELGKVNERLNELATCDGLTGLRNRRFLSEAMEDNLSRARRYGEPLSLLMLDVDHFKRFNDDYGHQAGDATLRIVATTLKSTSRQHDVVARYGGEEFVILAPQTGPEAARSLAERLRVAIEGRNWPNRLITVSIGVASLDLGVLDGAALLGRADRALYESKRQGRNRITHHDDTADCPEPAVR